MLVVVFALVFVPYITVICEIIALIRTFINKPLRGFGRFVKNVGPFVEMILFAVGMFLEAFLISLTDAVEIVNNNEFYSETWKYHSVEEWVLTVAIVIGSLFIISGLVLRFIKIEKTPSFLTGLLIALLCIGDAFAIIFTICISPGFDEGIWVDSYFFIIPVNVVMLTTRLIVSKVKERNKRAIDIAQK